MLTKRQRECLLFIQAHQAAHGGVSPSVREIAAAMGSRHSTEAAQSLLRGLEERGFIRRLPRRARAIDVLRPIPVARVFQWCDESKMLKPLNGN
jgi:repressor LexA